MASPPPRSSFDLSRLDPSSSSSVYAALVELRTKHLRHHRGGPGSVDRALVDKPAPLLRKLVRLLNRPNSKIVDVTLSILGNLMLSEGPRKAIRDKGLKGLAALVGILSTLGEESILTRAARAVANAAQDPRNAYLLHAEDVVEVLLKILSDAKESKTKQVIVRAFRILGNTEEHKRRVLESGAIAAVTSIVVQSPGDKEQEGKGEEEELLKTATRCLAHFTHGCGDAMAEQIRGEDGIGLRRLADLSRHPRRQVFESPLSCLVNLSHLANFRPLLGNSGFVVAIVDMLSSPSSPLSERETAHCVTALCLYCRESVNRMKLRECGGLRLFVRLLGERDKARMHDRIVNSLLQYSYDDASLLVLQKEGLVPKLVDLLEEFTERHGADHDCAEEICRQQREAEEDGRMSPVEEDGEEVPAEVQPEAPAPANVGNESSEDRWAGGQAEEPEEGELVEEEEGEARGEPSKKTFSSGDERAKQDEEGKDPPLLPPDPPARPLFRVNSPSYQAVQHEFEEYLRIQEEIRIQEQERASAYQSPFYSAPPDVPWSSDSPGCSRWQSPDRSPFAWSTSNSPGYSPARSPFSGASSSTGGSPDRRSLSPSSSPPGSPGSSRAASGSSPVYSPFAAPVSSPEMEDKEAEEGDATPAWSPVETFSDDETEAAASDPVPSTSKAAAAGSASSMPEGQTSLSPEPEKKKRRLADSAPSAKLVLPNPGSAVRKSIFSPTYEVSYNFPGPSSPQPTTPPPPPAPAEGEGGGVQLAHGFVPMRLPPRPHTHQATAQGGREARKEDSRAGWILQILSRLSQAERPHEDMSSLKTTQALVRYLSRIRNPIPRAGRILARLSKNMYCVMAFVFQRHLSWLKLYLDSRPTLPDCMCQGCQDLFHIRSNVTQNISLLAESGYAEGQMCHVLAVGDRPDKELVAVSAPMLVRPRRLLQNIMLAHDGLEVLLEVLESVKEKEESKEEEVSSQEKEEGEIAETLKLNAKKDCLFSDAVLSSCVLAGHVGVVAPNLKLSSPEVGECVFQEETSIAEDGDDVVVFVLDDGTELPARRSRLSDGSGVFSAMFGGSFAESGRRRVPLPGSGGAAPVRLLLHHLYGCRWCPAFSLRDGPDASAVLLDLVALSDRFLLPELNRSAAQEVVRRCLRASEVVSLYERSLRGNFQVSGCEESSLSSCAVSYLLVGAMPHAKRAAVFQELLKSRMSSDFADDVGKILRGKMLEVR